eukprot:747717-Hanusia_phi.AAC.1
MRRTLRGAMGLGARSEEERGGGDREGGGSPGNETTYLYAAGMGGRQVLHRGEKMKREEGGEKETDGKQRVRKKLVGERNRREGRRRRR